MTDIAILIVFVVTCAVLIEFRPRRLVLALQIAVIIGALLASLDWLPAWHGWLALLLTFVYIFWLYRALQSDEATILELRKLFEWVQRGQRWLRIQLANLFRRMKDIAAKARHRPPDVTPHTTGHPILASVLLTLTAIFTSIPASLIAAVIFAAGDMLTGAGSLSTADGGETARYLLGTTFVIWISGLQVAIDQFAITFPVIGLLAYATASLATRAQKRWAIYLGGALMLGAVCPALYVIASVTGQLGEPIFN